MNTRENLIVAWVITYIEKGQNNDVIGNRKKV